MTFDTDGPLGIVFRSTVPSAEGRAFVKALRQDSAAAKLAKLSGALERVSSEALARVAFVQAHMIVCRHTTHAQLLTLRCNRQWDTSWC